MMMFTILAPAAVPTDRQAQSRPLVPGLLRAVDLDKRLEDRRQLVRGDAIARDAHAQSCLTFAQHLRQL